MQDRGTARHGGGILMGDSVNEFFFAERGGGVKSLQETGGRGDGVYGWGRRGMKKREPQTKKNPSG